MNHNTENARVVVIGGGLAGLAAATYLARAGRAVTLFEKAGVVGGLAVTKRHGEFYFNRGAHALYYHAEAGEVLRELGVHYSGREPSLSMAWAVEGNRLHLLPTSSLALMRTTIMDVPAKLEFGRLLAMVQLLDPQTLRGVSLQEWLEQQVHHPQVRQFLSAYARLTTYTNAPQIMDAGFFMTLLRKIPRVLYLDGGWQTLVDGLRQAAEQAGVQIVTSARVEAIEHEEHVRGVRLAGGETCQAEAVVMAMDPAGASALVDGGTHAMLSRWAQEAVPAQAACLDVGLWRLPRPRSLFALGFDQPVYLSVHSAFAELAPKGGALVHTVKYLPPGEPGDPRNDEHELEALLDLVQPGWRAEVVERQFLPHLSVVNAVIQAKQGGLTGRPGPAVPGIQNLYVAGDWVGPLGQLSGASLASARQAAWQATWHPQGPPTSTHPLRATTFRMTTPPQTTARWADARGGGPDDM